jgi:hypothetical protein
MTDDYRDPLQTMRKSMALQEGLAALEQQKGPAANTKLMAELMMNAAQLARDIAVIEDRRGITPPSEPLTVDVRLVEGGWDDPLPDPDAPDPPPMPPAPPPEKPSADAKPASPSVDNVVPIRREQTIHEMAGVTQVSQPWRNYVSPTGTSYGEPWPNPSFGPGGRSRY